MKNKILLNAAALLCLSAVLSCKKFVDIPAPKNQLVAAKVFADSLDANSAIVGIYIDMYQSFGFAFASGGLTAYPGLSADEFSKNSNDPDLSQLFDNKIDIRNGYNQTLWTTAYKYIYDANACIEGINKSKISSSAKQKFIAEARQIRGFLYFNLVNLYGPVPLLKSADYHINKMKARDPVDSVYMQVKNDLIFAQKNLPKNNTAERANYYSACALLAKAELYNKNFAAAETAANLVINSGNYRLETELNNVFLANSQEAIWKLIPVFQGFETWEGYNFVPSDPSALPQFVLSDQLYNSFEAGDLRRANWTAISTIEGINYPYPFKYKAANTSGSPTENYVILRLGELYLIRSEARANLGDISGSQSDLNVIRNRAGLNNSTASDKSSLLLAIERERRSELFCEWGNRWFDLQRTNRADALLQAVKPNWNHNSILYPIPEAELKTNSALTQNPGY